MKRPDPCARAGGVRHGATRNGGVSELRKVRVPCGPAWAQEIAPHFPSSPFKSLCQDDGSPPVGPARLLYPALKKRTGP